ncbi:hypothetical protein DUNSADRAFT_10535 [Dunaliella salina]|uniref:Uncharacterized protein n=1 Tax=Dunaliella salina TaxID=3046 RepID=A0ABQ7GF42_DUNSA|nr:hypothetical protein DUNSADRAFT_10535 [Dunaliella salina]|eukprot:KAF5833220.1 hypothetical protein DUNSADRAFT_10535 [Dunaliella salina]
MYGQAKAAEGMGLHCMCVCAILAQGPCSCGCMPTSFQTYTQVVDKCTVLSSFQVVDACMACSPTAPPVRHALQLCASVVAVLCDAQQLLLLDLAFRDHAKVVHVCELGSKLVAACTRTLEAAGEAKAGSLGQKTKDVFQHVLRLSKQLAASLARPATQQQHHQEQQQLEPLMDDAAGDGYRQEGVVSSQLDLLVTQVLSGLLKPHTSALLPGLRAQVAPLLASLMQHDTKVPTHTHTHLLGAVGSAMFASGTTTTTILSAQTQGAGKRKPLLTTSRPTSPVTTGGKGSREHATHREDPQSPATGSVMRSRGAAARARSRSTRTTPGAVAGGRYRSTGTTPATGGSTAAKRSRGRAGEGRTGEEEEGEEMEAVQERSEDGEEGPARDAEGDAGEREGGGGRRGGRQGQQRLGEGVGKESVAEAVARLMGREEDAGAAALTGMLLGATSKAGAQKDALTDQLASAAAEAWRAGDSSCHTAVGAIALIHLLNPKGLRSERLRLTGSAANALIKLEMLAPDVESVLQSAQQVLGEQEELQRNGQGTDVAVVHEAQQRADLAGSVHSMLQRLLQLQT